MEQILSWFLFDLVLLEHVRTYSYILDSMMRKKSGRNFGIC